MRARWDFFIECTGVRFERVHKFAAKVTKEHAEAFGFPEQEFEALIDIEPDEESYSPTVEQTGRLRITLPGNQEQTKDLAFWLAYQASQQITFSQGKIKVSSGLIMGELLPDTPEEKAQLVDPFFGEANLVEVQPTPAFDASSLEKVTANPLIQQFNAADSAQNPIDRFLGLFKILEDLYGPTSDRVKIADSLKGSSELFQLAQMHLHITENKVARKMTADDFYQLVDKLVHTRHECAHLRSSKGFGITHGDPRARSEVEPLIIPLRSLTYAAIQMRL